MTYQAALNYLNSFINYERSNSYPYKFSFKFERMQRFLQLLGRPQDGLRVMHIAGSKGKGSTSAFIAYILQAAGFKVGLYTSPHLVDVRERIRILQKTEDRRQKTEKDLISPRDFARLMAKIKPSTEKLRETKLGGLSYYEILTALGFLYFKEKKCDFVVLETGLGGRLDATNVVDSLVCAITPISYEHTKVLGKTLKEIATEKAGIIKDRRERTAAEGEPRQRREDRGQIVVSAPQRPAAFKVIQQKAKERQADLFVVGKDIQIKEQTAGLAGQLFNVCGLHSEYRGLKVRLLGRHQIVNAAVAIGCLECLRHFGTRISSQAIRKGLLKTCWPGRLEIISQRPYIVLDAAHNRESAQVLRATLEKFFKYRNLNLVFGVSRDKDVRGMLKELLPKAKRIILTQAQNPRAMAPEIIKTFIKSNHRAIILTDNAKDALKIAREKTSEKDLILVCGSLFLVGEILGAQRR